MVERRFEEHRADGAWRGTAAFAVEAAPAGTMSASTCSWALWSMVLLVLPRVGLVRLGGSSQVMTRANYFQARALRSFMPRWLL